jgi:Fe(3+) dicitrate transport protein
MMPLRALLMPLFLSLTAFTGPITDPTPGGGNGDGLPAVADSDPGASARLTGLVTSSDGKVPLAGVAVEAEGLERRSETDRLGHFSLSGLPSGAGEITLVFRRIGFAEERLQIDLEPGRTTRVEVELRPRAVELDPVAILLERTRMVGDPMDGMSIPGSAFHLRAADLASRTLAFDNVHDVLRQVPGMNLQDEEGYGMRPHIGMRGVGAERSGNVTLMEDGILIAPAPYSAPAAYFFPTTGRLEGIEVRKGASQIRYGPRTLGGAVNLLSSAIPDRRSWLLDASGGADERIRTRARIGDSGVRYGWLVEGFQSRTDGFKELQMGGDTGFELWDFMGKLRLNSAPDAPRYQALELKVGRQEQTADETYLGLTETDFRRTPNLRYAASAEDVLDTEQWQLSARYFLQASARTDVVVTGYHNRFARNWYKLQSVGGSGIAGVLAAPEASPELFAILRGAPSDDDALRLRANNRGYESEGVQAVAGFRNFGDNLRHNIEVGLRLHRDFEDRLQWEDGYRMTPAGMVRTSSGVPGTQDNRRGEARALALFVQDEIRAGRWSLVPGLRWESVELSRLDWERTDGERTDEPRTRDNTVSTLIPGVGVTWEWTPRVHIFGGVHRGFGPPGPGADGETRVEESVNYELGLRVRRAAVGADVTAFYSDYDNILGASTLATGEAGTGELFNGGEVQTFGLELATDVELGRLMGLPVRLPARASYAFIRGEFQTSFSSGYGPWGTVQAGDRIPYLPEHTWSGSLGLQEGGWDLSLEWNGVTAMRTEAGRGAIPPETGADGYHLFHLNAARDLGSMATVYGGLQNLTDQRYVVSRRPAGARPGLPRTFFLGFRVTR